jgi:hypothetical protein
MFVNFDLTIIMPYNFLTGKNTKEKTAREKNIYSHRLGSGGYNLQQRSGRITK